MCSAHDNHLCQFCFNRAKSKPIQKREGYAYPSRFLLHIHSGLTSPYFKGQPAVVNSAKDEEDAG